MPNITVMKTLCFPRLNAALCLVAPQMLAAGLGRAEGIASVLQPYVDQHTLAGAFTKASVEKCGSKEASR